MVFKLYFNFPILNVFSWIIVLEPGMQIESYLLKLQFL